MTTVNNDQEERLRALDPSSSFIVQAPAGSGKTELLIQRYLTLLSLAHYPEEIVAITFTRKAAAEMRTRIIHALQTASNNEIPDSEHKLTTYNLSKQVYERDRQQGWNLILNPNRLRLVTIDSLCAMITRQMPILTRFGAEPMILEDATTAYQRAARALFKHLDADSAWADGIARLLQHLDNHYEKVEYLLIAMLQCRDQWLPYILGNHSKNELRHALEDALKNAVYEALESCRAAFPFELQDELLELIRFASCALRDDPNSPLQSCLDLEQLPLYQIDQWLAIAHLLLTKENEWRKTVNKNLGFFASNNNFSPEEKIKFALMKRRMEQLLLRCTSYESFQHKLATCRKLPPIGYSNTQWQIMEILFDILPVLVAELTLVFRDLGAVDFIEVTHAALQALGTAEEPTDLALALDYQIKHLLVDEFQDTSITHFKLLEKILSGWQTDDSRTLFLVGDPMQSIYRFRQAEVGLFLRTRRQGIGNLTLMPLTLQMNFRSQANIVNWVNQTFCAILPATENSNIGAVSYSSSIPSHAAATNEINWHPLLGDDSPEDCIITIIRTTQEKFPEQSIAILVKARSHIFELLPRLRQENINYRAIEIEQLANRMVIQDLWSLTRALLNLADRIAWLAVLRAPWCGLTLNDLHTIAGEDKFLTLWDRITNPFVIEKLSEDGQRRVKRCQAVLETYLEFTQRIPLHDHVRSVWLTLGGPAVVNNPTELEDANVFFNLLEEYQQGGLLTDYAQFIAKINHLFATPNVVANDKLQIMTIHKAKGLEFDTVILPALERKNPIDEHRLLMWMERTKENTNQTELLLAPIKASEETHDPIYSYLRQLDQQKDFYEQGRLLYVAVTRAKQQLHLLGSVKLKNGQLETPVSKSFLGLLWPQALPAFNAALLQHVNHEDKFTPLNSDFKLKRLTHSWSLPLFENTIETTESPYKPGSDEENSYDNAAARHIGTLIHRILQHIAQQRLNIEDESLLKIKQQVWRKLLQQQGLKTEEIDNALLIIRTALDNIRHDEKAQWILKSHTEAQSEYALNAVTMNTVQQFIVDRTFIDEHNVRWIIDYKTSVPKMQKLGQFLRDQKLRYQEQLQYYAQAFRLLENRKIKLALYFPLIPAWQEWEDEHGC